MTNIEQTTVLVPKEPFFIEFADEIHQDIDENDHDNCVDCVKYGYDFEGLMETLDSPLTDEERTWYEGLAISLAKVLRQVTQKYNR